MVEGLTDYIGCSTQDRKECPGGDCTGIAPCQAKKIMIMSLVKLISSYPETLKDAPRQRHSTEGDDIS